MTDSQPNMFEISPDVRIPRALLRFSFSRSSGPGGQAVNKLSTRAELRIHIRDVQGLPWDAADRLRKLCGRRLTQDDEIILTAEASRSQLDNKQECLDRLRAMIEQALIRPKTRRKTKPSKSKIEKRLAGKKRAGSVKKLRSGKSGTKNWD